MASKVRTGDQKTLLSKIEFYTMLLRSEEWSGLAGKGWNSIEVQSFLKRFYNEKSNEFQLNFTLEAVKSRLIISKKQLSAFPLLRLDDSLFIIDQSCVNFPIISPFFDRICQQFALILVQRGKNEYSYKELVTFYNSQTEFIRAKLQTEKDITGALDVIGKLVKHDFLLHHRGPRQGEMRGPANKLSHEKPRRTEHVGSSNSEEDIVTDEANIIHTGRRKVITDQHYGVRVGQKETDEQNEDDGNTRLLQDLTKQSNRLKVVGDRDGVEISCDKDDAELGTINFGTQGIGEKSTACVTVKFVDEAISGRKLKFRCNFGSTSEQFGISNNDNVKSFELESGQYQSFNITYTSCDVGSHDNIMIFSFNIVDEKNFMIVRFIRGQTAVPEMDHIKSTGAYSHPKPVIAIEDKDVDIVRGIPPESSGGNVGAKVPLKDYKIPGNLRSNVNNGKGRVTDDWLKLLEEPLSKHNYAKKFHALLHLEELQMEIDIRRYDMHRVPFEAKGSFLTLEVPGLGEGRPSIIVGDRIIAGEIDGDGNVSKTKYEGYIHEIQDEKVLIKFATSFHRKYIKGTRYDVRFVFNRFTMRLQHRALDITDDLIKRNVFPAANLSLDETYPSILSERDVSRMRVRDRKVETNPEQLQAVKNIVMGTSRPHPYVIFGPPGTGKTMTIVEAIRQVLLLIPGSRVLVCAPSNSAADLLLHRLLNPSVIDKSQFFRINAVSRSVITLRETFEDILENCLLDNDKRKFEIPNVQDILQYRVIVSTNMTAGRLVSMGVPVGHFTHVFMDEAGQAVEPESIISLAGLFSPEIENGGQIVLAGDPKQLAPVLRSPLACKYGLQLSLMERLMKYPKYQKRSEPTDQSSDSESSSSDDSDGSDDFFANAVEELEQELENKGTYDQRFITKLVNNYRSHPAILKLPNELFYDNELVPAADEFATSSLCQWNTLPNKEIPILFHGVKGVDQREKNSPSFFNREEATSVLGFVRQLLAESRLGIKPDQIGVISPYRKQVEKIRQLFKLEKGRIDMKKIKVGSVEEFQGQERRVIIISTVRSNKDFLLLDAKFRLGFLRNPKRFNVAVTRAKALIIIVGNPFVLSNDNFWNRFLEYCIENKCYTGCKFKTEAENMQDIIDQFQKMGIDVNSEFLNYDLPWERRE